MGFPKDFVWGVAAAAYQIEGAVNEDGRGLCVWDMYGRNAGNIREGDVADVACDHYHRYKEDVGIMKEIGVRAYRMSTSWPRIIPSGTGAVNPKGLEFYDKLIDELLAADVTPYVTLFHWDFPYELYCRGGWLNPDISDCFAEYTRVVVERLSDRVKHWMTINEPQWLIGGGLQLGTFAPGDKLGFAEVLLAGHHSLIAHGKCVQAIRANAKTEPLVAYAPANRIFIPQTDSPEDVAAARNRSFSIFEKTCWNNAWWLDPVYFGKYPEDGVELYGKDMPEIRDGDMETICQPLDFFAINIYDSEVVKASDGEGGVEIIPNLPGYAQTSYRWPITADVLYWAPKFYYERYKQPVYITESGMSNMDWVALDGKVHDPQRIDFLTRYLRELARACDDNIDVRGYFHWSIMDNFEWSNGFCERFGLVYVDFQTGKRTLKDSAYWYKEVIKTNGAHMLDTQ